MLFSKPLQKLTLKALCTPTVAERVINKLTNSTCPRPYPFSLWTPRSDSMTEQEYLDSVSDYTSWVGLFDQTYTKRHLPPVSKEFIDALPKQEDLLALFKRENPIPGASDSADNVSRHTSTLFTFFAQWFTDSFLRTDTDDWHKNSSNHEIDLCQIYGLKESTTRILREHQGGRMKSQIINGQEYPPFLCERDNHTEKIIVKPEFQELPRMQEVLENFDEAFCPSARLSEEEKEQRKLQLFVAGLDRANSSVGYSMMNIVFLRAHNHICKQLQTAHEQWDDERIFQTTRNVLIIILIKIVVIDYIKHISGGAICAMPRIGFAEKQKWYRKNWIAVEFSLLYRWHFLLPDKLTTKIGDDPSLTFKDFMYNPAVLLNNDIAELAAAWSAQAAGASGLFNTPDFLMEAKKRSLAFARKARLASFNDYREVFGFKKLASFDDLNAAERTREALRELYKGDINKLEFLPGLWAEQPSPAFVPGLTGLYDQMLGSSILTMVGVDAFSQALTNPLLSENIYNEKTFSAKGLEIIDSINSLSQLMEIVVDDAANKNISFRLPAKKE